MATNTDSGKFSAYYDGLYQIISKKRYREKVGKLGGLGNPYLLLEQGRVMASPGRTGLMLNMLIYLLPH